jgi:LacI family transcriptional regulator
MAHSKTSPSAPTLVHVARLAGVGLGTASRALGGQGYVSEKTLARIQFAAKQLGYERNELARSLKLNRSGAIGLVVPDIGGSFMASCVRGVQKIVRQHGHTLVITFTGGNSEVEADEIGYLVRHRIDGVIVVPADNAAAHFRASRFANVPLVSFDQPIVGNEYDAILVKNRQGAQLAVQHLIEHGHKRIACLGENGQMYSIQQRISGYRAAMKQAGLPEMLCIVDPEKNGIAKQIDEWMALKSRPTAIFGLNELTTLQTVQAFATRGIRMPDQIAFIGFDDIQLGPYLEPPLTVVLQPANEIGEHAASRLLERIGATEPIPQKRVMLEPTLVIRGSCGCPPKSNRTQVAT